MKPVIQVAFLLACAFPLGAQITARLNRLPDGMDELRIRNNSATSQFRNQSGGVCRRWEAGSTEPREARARRC